jgi:hypothetical protein
VSPRLLIRMKPEVQVLPGPPHGLRPEEMLVLLLGCSQLGRIAASNNLGGSRRSISAHTVRLTSTSPVPERLSGMPVFSRTAVVERITFRGMLMPPVRAARGQRLGDAWVGSARPEAPSRRGMKSDQARGRVIACRGRGGGRSRPPFPRPVTPSLARILETWTPAVLGVMNSAWPICRLVRRRLAYRTDRRQLSLPAGSAELALLWRSGWDTRTPTEVPWPSAEGTPRSRPEPTQTGGPGEISEDLARPLPRPMGIGETRPSPVRPDLDVDSSSATRPLASRCWMRSTLNHQHSVVW